MSPIFSDSWPTLKGFRVGHLNVNHYINKYDEISKVLLNDSLDVFGLTESRLNQKIEDCELYIPGFNIIRCDPSAVLRTGICIYVRSSLNFARRYDLETGNIECIWIEVFLKRCSVFICFLYRNPKENALWEDCFARMIDDVVALNKAFMILGDFNINFKKNPTSLD